MPSLERATVLAQDNVRDRHRVVKSAFSHGVGATGMLLVRLEDKSNSTSRASPLSFGVVEESCCGHEAGHVHIVSTSMHGRLITAPAVGHPFCAGIRQTCILFNRECIELGSQEDGWAVSIAQHPDDSGTTRTPNDLEIEIA